jgi:predicted dehydrogenase
MASLSSSSFGLAIVGCGQIVTHHLAALSSIDKGENIKLRALCDPSSDRRIDISQLPASQSLMPHGEQEVGFYETLDDLVSDVSMFATIDIIFIAVPHDLHESLTMQALACSDKIIVLEKPLAPTLSSCDHLVQASQIAAKSNNSMLIVAEQSPYWQEVVLAKRLIADGAIGTIVTAASYYYESMRTNHTSGDVDATGGLGWRGSVARAGGGKRRTYINMKVDVNLIERKRSREQNRQSSHSSFHGDHRHHH